MKKYFALFLSMVMMLTALIVPINISAQTINWSDELGDKYVFDFTNELYRGDKVSKASGGHQFDTSLPWNYGAVTFDAGYDRGVRSVYPVLGTFTLTQDWGPQGYSQPGSVTLANGSTVNTLSVHPLHNGYFVPLTEEGTPFELAPDHEYTVKYSYYVNIGSASNQMLEACVGLASHCAVDYSSNKNKICDSDTRIGWLYSENKQIKSGEFKINSISASAEGYDAATNTRTITVDGAQYELGNYLYFYFSGNVQNNAVVLDMISLEITRDDFSTKGTVEYYDADGTTLLHSEDVLIGNFSPSYIPTAPEGKFFSGWYTDKELTNKANTVILTEAGLKLYAKWGSADSWDDGLDTYYAFDFSNVGYYTDQLSKANGGIQLDSTKPWETTVTYDAGFGRGNRTLYPVYTHVSGNNWGPQSWSQPGSVVDNGENVTTWQLNSYHSANNMFVPLKADGTPFELANGHKYTVNVKYCVDSIVEGSPVMDYCAGLYMDGAPKYDYTKQNNPLKVAGDRFAWLTATVGQVTEISLTLDLTNVTNAAYDVQSNSYVLNYSGENYTLYNYFYFAITAGKAVVDIISLDITRDDYVPDIDPVDWNEALEDHYVFDFDPEYVDYMTDIQDHDSYDRLDNSKIWTAAPISVDSGFGRGNRSIYAAWGPTTPNRWGPQIWSWPETINYEGKFTNTMAVDQVNPGAIVPLKKDGTPLELAPGHTYTVDIVFQKNEFDSDAGNYGNNALRANVGYSATSGWAQEVHLDSQKLADISITSGSEGEIIKASAQITVPAADSEGYNEIYNSFVTQIGDTEYTLNNYFYLVYDGYAKARLNIIALEVTRDDYVYVEYTDTYLISDNIENNSTYKIDFEYKIKGELSDNCGFAFKYAKEDGNFVTYVEGKDKILYTIPQGKSLNEWHTATVLLTTDVYALVDNSVGYNDTLTAVNKLLYCYIDGEDNAINLELKNFSVKKLLDSAGNDFINVMGAACLTDGAEEAAGCQALRYMFTYDTKTGAEINIDGTDYAVRERGFIYANGNLYAKDGVYKGDINVTNAKAGKFLTNCMTDGFDNCWAYSEIEGTDYYSLVFSTYATDFLSEDTKELLVKAYVVVEVDGQEFTVYSDAINRSVDYIKKVL